MTKRELLKGTIIDYFGNSADVTEIEKLVNRTDIDDILAGGLLEWNSVEVDAEGPSVSQDMELDSIVEGIADLLEGTR